MKTDKQDANKTRKKPLRKKGRKKALDLCGFGKKQDRKDCNKAHFMTRYEERCGFHLRHYQYDQILNLIQESKPINPTKDPNRFIYHINYNNFNLRVVYDNKFKSLVTVLPPHKKSHDL